MASTTNHAIDVQWKFDDPTGEWVATKSPAMVRLEDWAMLHQFGGKLVVTDVPCGWNCAYELGPQGPRGLQGPRGFFGVGSLYPVPPPKPVDFDQQVLHIICNTKLAYTEGEWIPNIVNPVGNNRLSVGSIKSTPVYRAPVLRDGSIGKVLTGVTQPKPVFWNQFMHLNKSKSVSQDEYFGNVDGNLIADMLTSQLDQAPNIPVLSVDTKDDCFAGFYETTISILASEFGRDETIVRVIKSIMWQDCKPTPSHPLPY